MDFDLVVDLIQRTGQRNLNHPDVKKYVDPAYNELCKTLPQTIAKLEQKLQANQLKINHERMVYDDKKRLIIDAGAKEDDQNQAHQAALSILRKAETLYDSLSSEVESLDELVEEALTERNRSQDKLALQMQQLESLNDQLNNMEETHKDLMTQMEVIEDNKEQVQNYIRKGVMQTVSQEAKAGVESQIKSLTQELSYLKDKRTKEKPGLTKLDRHEKALKREGNQIDREIRQDERVALSLEKEIADNKLDFDHDKGAEAREKDLVNSLNEKNTRINANSSKKQLNLQSIEECKREKKEKNFALKEMAQDIRDKEAKLTMSKQELINMHLSKQLLEQEAQKFQNEMTQLMEKMEKLDQEKERADKTKIEFERQLKATEAEVAYHTQDLDEKVQTLNNKRAEFLNVAKVKNERENEAKGLQKKINQRESMKDDLMQQMREAQNKLDKYQKDQDEMTRNKQVAVTIAGMKKN